ncbi:NACHT domain-containing protein [Streptomyces sp. TX20-6-3]|uniref:NACHT domain-containing protein n=1 Tax=Streptomyces sp. TX20-6-3 TaxID=3028705 RepID=UPI0029AF2A6A|nr:NACHT domain-containing protein [Streptomyces sp. TX20-6-3]MDX2562805.1 NACHT domain-containing protein [Streptomyces sp. TX20-6-3]
MEPALIGTRLASAAIGPILRKLLVSDGPGAGLTGRSEKVRLSSLVSFHGEKCTLTEKDVRKLAGTLVGRSVDGAGAGERPFPADEAEAVTDTLATTLLALGDLDMDDVQAVRLGHTALARRLRAAAPAPDGLSTDSVRYLESMTEWACLHILDFFTQRSTFVARSLVEQTRGQSELIAKLDEVIRRVPRADGRDAEFERRYLAHLAKKHGRLTIYGVDLRDAPEKWPLDVAYLSLEATGGPSQQNPWAGSDPDTAAFADIRAAGHLGAPLGGRADQILARHDKVLLRGAAGSGKTTLVQWLAVSAAREDTPTGDGHADGMAYLQHRIPFVLPLRALTRHGERLPAPDRFLSAVGCPLTPPDGWADRVLAAGRGLVLVDGIDEIPEAERDRARRWLRDLLDAYDGNRWLVTSRPTAVSDDWLASDGFAELTLAPMSSPEVATFVRRWHRAAGPEAAPYEQPLLDALRTTADVAQLATNPLMCGLICALHHGRRGFLPRGRKALYDAALAMLLSRRDRERDMGTPYGVDLGDAPQIQLIQRLAYWLTLNGRTTMDRAHAESVVREAVPAITEAAGYDPGAVFTHLLHRSGLLREPTAETVDFVHRTFQDYLAAKALVDRWDIGVLVRHAADDQWEDVIRMAVGHARPRECAEIFDELMKAADAAPDRRTELRVVVVAATALDHATEVAPEVRERILARTAEVIPPRGAEEARELAWVGRAVLELLPGPEGLADEAALDVTTAATHVADDATLPYLARFAEHTSLIVRSQLMWGWSRFDPTRYAEEIIARLDPTDLDFTLGSDEQAAEVVRLGMRPTRLDLRAGLTHDGVAMLREAVEGAQRLRVVGDLVGLVAPFLARNELRSFTLVGPAVEGLAFLHDLTRLTSLDLGGSVHLSEADWGATAAMDELRELFMSGRSMRSIPESLRLPQVRLLALTCDDTSVPLDNVARAFPGLRSLFLLGGAGTALDLAPLASLSRLISVIAHDTLLTGAEHLAPTVTIHT